MSELRLPYLNKVVLTGRLTIDPEVRHTSDSKPVTLVRIASNRNYKDAGHQWQQETTYVTIVAWGRTGKVAAEQLKKGHAVLVEGSLKSREIDNGTSYTLVEITAQSLQFLNKK